MRSLPPPDLLKQISNSASVADFEGSFPHVRYEVDRYLKLAGCDFHSFSSILDMGCGVGRFAYAMAPVLQDNQELFGCDLDARCAKWSAENAGYAEVVRNSLHPPLPWPNEKFDFIYALSVFTHLTFEHQLRWTWELLRVVKPGGTVMITTHGLGHLGPALTGSLDWQNREYFLIDESAIFASLSIGGGESIEGQTEVAAFHNREAVARQFEPLSLTLHEHVSNMAGGQSMNILTKAVSGSPAIFAADVIQSGSDGARVRVPDSPSAARRELRGFLQLPTARFDLQGLQVAVTYNTGNGTSRKEFAKLRTPVCLGPHHRMSFRSELVDAMPGSAVSIRLEHQGGDPLPAQPVAPHWAMFF